MPTLLLGVSFIAFAVIALVPIASAKYLPWYTVNLTWTKVETEGEKPRDIELRASGSSMVWSSNPESEVEITRESHRPEGLSWKGMYIPWLTMLAAAGALLLAVATGSAWAGKLEGASRSVVIACTVASVGVAVTLIVWQTAWMWKVVTLDKQVRMTTPSDSVNPSQVLGEREFVTRPGFGLYLGIGLALAAALFISMAMKKHVRIFWLHVAEAFGLIAGAVILLMVVEPWDARNVWNGLEPFFRR
jgi:hypothetical protein